MGKILVVCRMMKIQLLYIQVYKTKTPNRIIGRFRLERAENETRTRDPNLGKVVLYQLSYFRLWYRRWDLNPHARNEQGILSPSCLPFHHFGSSKNEFLFEAAKIQKNHYVAILFDFFIKHLFVNS